ncbi:MAG: hypothetical protein NT015_08040 [Alphaproteobacteria bacterium]|nr:hypothetical protein [Alphaproteobacteria bacterium]
MNDSTTPPYRAEALALEKAPAFEAAVIQLASDLAAFYQAHSEAAAMFADVGQLAIVSGLLALPAPITEADLCRLVGAGALASRRRVRNHIARLERAGLTHIAAGGDRRTRPIVATSKLEGLLNAWVRALASAAANLCDVDRTKLARSDLARFYLHQVMASHQVGFSAFAATPTVARLVNLSRGHALVLELLAASLRTNTSEVLFSRRAFASAYGVSRTHVIDLLSECEATGIITPASAHTLALSPTFLAEARHWAAINFALAAATLEGRLMVVL